MNWAFWGAVLWVFAATATAFLPMRRQYAPGIVLLILAPVMIVWLGMAHGWIWSVIGLLAFISMFRNPLRHLLARARGVPTEGSQ
jgi:ACR3 family arsenite efflux pump ArsB